MYAYIKGTVADLETDAVIIDNNGIGYRILVPGSLLHEVSTGDTVKLYTYFAVREDAMQLYGFFTKDDLALFKLLIGVSGIGPKGAIGMLGALSADEIRFAVLADDAAAISKAPGIGKKTAQKVIIELKDKLNLEDAFELKAAHADDISGLGASNGRGEVAGQEMSAQDEAVMALTALGYPSAQALKAVRAAAALLGAEADVEDLLKASLKELI